MKKRNSKSRAIRKDSKGKKRMDYAEESGYVSNSFLLPLRLYTVNVYYGGGFVHVPEFSNTSNVKKVINEVDLENMSVDELKVYMGDILGEFDSLYFNKPQGAVKLTNDRKEDVIQLSRVCGNICVLYAYHVTDNEDSYGGCSDEEFEEIRRSTMAEKERIEQYEEHANNAMAEIEETVRLDDIIQEPPTASQSAPNNAIKFMPTPSLWQHTGDGCTPPASTPPGPAKKRTPRKSVMFLAPRKK